METYREKLAHIPDFDLDREIARSFEKFNKFKAFFLVGLTYFHARNLAPVAGSPNTLQWLLRRHNIARSTAYEYINVASRLLEFPRLTDSFCAVKITYSAVRLLLRYLKPENEEELVALAEQLTYSELVHALAGRPQAGEGEEDSEPDEYLRVWVDEDGYTRIEGFLSPTNGAKFAAALKKAELLQSADEEDLQPAEVRVESWKEEKSATADNNTEPQPTKVSRFGGPAPHGLVSALLGMINVTLSSSRGEITAPGAQVNLIYSDQGHSFLPGNPDYKGKDIIRHMLNGDLRAHVVNEKGLTINYGRKRRLVSQGLANTLLCRWRFQCATPGCTHTRFLEFHHIKEWRHGGLTDEENLIPLCSACHSLVSSNRMEIEESGERLYFRFADGTVYFSENRALPVIGDREPSQLPAA